jgi:hypothetical protein
VYNFARLDTIGFLIVYYLFSYKTESPYSNTTLVFKTHAVSHNYIQTHKTWKVNQRSSCLIFSHKQIAFNYCFRVQKKKQRLSGTKIPLNTTIHLQQYIATIPAIHRSGWSYVHAIILCDFPIACDRTNLALRRHCQLRDFTTPWKRQNAPLTTIVLLDTDSTYQFGSELYFASHYSSRNHSGAANDYLCIHIPRFGRGPAEKRVDRFEIVNNSKQYRADYSRTPPGGVRGKGEKCNRIIPIYH